MSRSSDHREPPETSSEETWRELGRDAMLAGDPADALWCLRRAIETDADDATAWHLLARCFDEIGERRRARRCHALAARLRMRQAGRGEAVEVAAIAPLVTPRGSLDS